MRAKAQAEILERKPEAAIADLNQVLDARPESVAVMLDLSIAYAQQGDISLDPANYATAWICWPGLGKRPGEFDRSL